MQSSFTARSAYGDMVMEEQMDGGLVIQVRDGIESSQIRLTPDQASALRTWLDSQPPAAPVVRTAGGIVAYQSKGGRVLRCLAHAPDLERVDIGDFHQLTSEDLPDGGICTYLDCGRDVLIPLKHPTVVRTASGIDYVAWRNRIRRAAGQHPEA